MTSHSELEEDYVRETFRMFKEACRDRLRRGHIIEGLTPETRMALLHDKMIRWFETRDEDEILMLTIDSFFAFNTVRPNHEVEKEPASISEADLAEFDAEQEGLSKDRAKFEEDRQSAEA